MDAVVVQTLTHTHAPAIAALANYVYRGDSGRTSWTSEADIIDGQRLDADMAREMIQPPDRLILGSFSGELLVGCVHIARHETYGYFGLLTVHPQMQSSGLGGQLLNSAERHAAEVWNMKNMRMCVITQRPELIAWYRRRGYKPIGETIAFSADPRFGIPKVAGLTLEYYEKDLAQGVSS
jgi:ribosomal protein S18 acetylase RimI-like enzyme